MAATLALLPALAPSVGHAQIAAGFAGKFTINNAYVTAAAGATDVAFTADGRALVTTKTGSVIVRHADGTKNTLNGLFGTVDSAIEKGLLGVVADPTVANTFYFYVSNGTTNDDKHRVIKGVLNADNSITVNATPVIAASRGNGPGLWGPANHDGGGLFIYQNQLYVGVGDTGHNTSPPTNQYASCLNKGNGKILRVNLDGSVPNDNPLASTTMATACDTANTNVVTGPWQMAPPDRRIYAWGLRNPWRFWIDPHTGLFWIGDVGEVTQEEVSVGRGNQHYGYPFLEGNMDWRGSNGITGITSCEQESPTKACTPPVYAYPRNVGDCVIGGLIPEGCGWLNAFTGKLYYLLGDNDGNWVRGLEVKPDRTGVVSATPVDFGTFANGPASFRMGPDAALYIVLNATGAVARVVPTSLTGADCTGTGGAGGAGGTSATGGAAGTGVGGTVGAGGSGTGGSGAGRGGTAGIGAAGAAPGTGGASSSSGGAATGTAGTTGTGTAGGAVASGGTTASGGAAAAGNVTATGGGATGSDSSGCGCHLVGQRSGSTAALAAGLALLGLVRRRRARKN